MEATEAGLEDPLIQETREKLDDKRQKGCRKRQPGKQSVEVFQTQLERDTHKLPLPMVIKDRTCYISFLKILNFLL